MLRLRSLENSCWGGAPTPPVSPSCPNPFVDVKNREALKDQAAQFCQLTTVNPHEREVETLALIHTATESDSALKAPLLRPCPAPATEKNVPWGSRRRPCRTSSTAHSSPEHSALFFSHRAVWGGRGHSQRFCAIALARQQGKSTLLSTTGPGSLGGPAPSRGV